MNLIQIFLLDRAQEPEPLPPLLDQTTKSALTRKLICLRLAIVDVRAVHLGQYRMAYST